MLAVERLTYSFPILTAPYGIREGGRKLGSKKETTWDIPAEE